MSGMHSSMRFRPKEVLASTLSEVTVRALDVVWGERSAPGPSRTSTNGGTFGVKGRQGARSSPAREKQPHDHERVRNTPQSTTHTRHVLVSRFDRVVDTDNDTTWGTCTCVFSSFFFVFRVLKRFLPCCSPHPFFFAYFLLFSDHSPSLRRQHALSLPGVWLEGDLCCCLFLCRNLAVIMDVDRASHVVPPGSSAQRRRLRRLRSWWRYERQAVSQRSASLGFTRCLDCHADRSTSDRLRGSSTCCQLCRTSSCDRGHVIRTCD